MCSLTKTRPMLVLLATLAAVILISGTAVSWQVRQRQVWRARERARMLADRNRLEEVKRRQRQHDFVIDEVLLSEALRKELK